MELINDVEDKTDVIEKDEEVIILYNLENSEKMY